MFTAVIPALILRLFGLKKLADRLVFWQASLISKFGFFLAGVRVHVVGDVQPIRQRVEDGQGFCFVSNHTSILDILLMLGYLRCKTGFVAKKELLYIPFINVLIAMVHSVFIDRGNLRKSVAAIQHATRNIQHGQSMVIFPEGTRSKTGQVGTFKHGSFRMATESGAPVVPLTVKGIRDSFESRRHFFQHRDAYLHIGTPLQPPLSTNRESASAFISQVESQIRSTYATLGA